MGEMDVTNNAVTLGFSTELMDVIKNADHIIDLGPGAGDKGGYVVATGTPEEIANEKSSATGQYLIKVLPKDIQCALTS